MTFDALVKMSTEENAPWSLCEDDLHAFCFISSVLGLPTINDIDMGDGTAIWYKSFGKTGSMSVHFHVIEDKRSKINYSLAYNDLPHNHRAWRAIAGYLAHAGIPFDVVNFY